MEFNSGFKGLMKLEFSRQIFQKYLNTKFHKTSSSGCRVAPCGQTNTQRV